MHRVAEKWSENAKGDFEHQAWVIGSQSSSRTEGTTISLTRADIENLQDLHLVVAGSLADTKQIAAVLLPLIGVALTVFEVRIAMGILAQRK